jgi:serine/threonine protein kinase
MKISLQCPACGEPSRKSSRCTRCGHSLDPSSGAEPSPAMSFGADPRSSLVAPVLDPSSGAEPSPAMSFGADPRSSLVAPVPVHQALARVGKYRIIRELGRGGFGMVYLAHDDGLDRPIALKIALLEVVRDPELRERFFKDVHQAARMQHEGIVNVYDVGIDGEWCYIASEFLNGRTLREVLDEGPLELEKAVRITRDLALALDYAHGERVIHGDVKPSNVIILSDGKVKLLDFGLAHLYTSIMNAELSLTDVQASMGTAAYMSPEQVMGETGKIGNASDQYSLGVVLYEMLCGSTPFRGSALRVKYEILKTPAPSFFEITAKEFPPALEAICMKTLTKDPEVRYASCRSLASSLDDWLNARERDVKRPALRANERPESSLLFRRISAAVGGLLARFRPTDVTVVEGRMVDPGRSGDEVEVTLEDVFPDGSTEYPRYLMPRRLFRRREFLTPGAGFRVVSFMRGDEFVFKISKTKIDRSKLDELLSDPHLEALEKEQDSLIRDRLQSRANMA